MDAIYATALMQQLCATLLNIDIETRYRGTFGSASSTIVSIG